MNGFQQNELTNIIEIDKNKCKGCDSCKAFCPTGAVQGKYGAVHYIDHELCIFCGQCLINCPFGSIRDNVDNVDVVIDKLRNPAVTVVATTAPAVRVAIGEEFGMEPGTLSTEKLYGALKQAGFKLIDANFSADHTILEEGSELIAKINHYLLGAPAEHPLGPLPQFTSCCPGWIRFAELNYPEILPHLSSAKSPIQMAGALAKTYGARTIWNVRPEDMYVVSIAPCTSKKFEASRPEFTSAAQYWQQQGATASYPDVDTVLTTRDLARLLKKMGIDFNHVAPFTDDDNPLAQYSGAATIFGNTGGVMEAALRTAYFVLSGEELPVLEYTPVRGLDGLKEAKVSIRDARTGKLIELKVAVVHGTKDNVRPVVEQVIAGTSPYHFIEVMNCPGGCINGGGQPINPMGTSWMGKFKALMPWN